MAAFLAKFYQLLISQSNLFGRSQSIIAPRGLQACHAIVTCLNITSILRIVVDFRASKTIRARPSLDYGEVKSFVLSDKGSIPRRWETQFTWTKTPRQLVWRSSSPPSSQTRAIRWNSWETTGDSIPFWPVFSINESTLVVLVVSLKAAAVLSTILKFLKVFMNVYTTMSAKTPESWWWLYQVCWRNTQGWEAKKTRRRRRVPLWWTRCWILSWHTLWQKSLNS